MSLFFLTEVKISFELGLRKAAHKMDMAWVVIKGVSDFADGKKFATDYWRPFASVMAPSLTAHILTFEPWVHYGGMY